MIGAIRRRDIFCHPRATIQCFGWTTFFRALAARNGHTFLSVVEHAGARPLPTLVERAADLERRLGRVYRAWAVAFAEQPAARDLFERLAAAQDCHSELAELCGAAGRRGRWEEEQFTAWRHEVPRLEQELQTLEARAAHTKSLADALRLVLEIESSELNHVRLGVVAASDSDFVRELDVFWQAGHRHLATLCAEIPRLTPELADDCRAVSARYQVHAA